MSLVALPVGRGGSCQQVCPTDVVTPLRCQGFFLPPKLLGGNSPEDCEAEASAIASVSIPETTVFSPPLYRVFICCYFKLYSPTDRRRPSAKWMPISVYGIGSCIFLNIVEDFFDGNFFKKKTRRKATNKICFSPPRFNQIQHPQTGNHDEQFPQSCLAPCPSRFVSGHIARGHHRIRDFVGICTIFIPPY